MGSPYSFPGVDSPFLNLYNQFAQNTSFGGDYLNPEDPDFQKYLELSTKPTGSENLIRDYVDRRPSYEEYNPSFGRKMAAFLLGTLSGKGYEGAQKHLFAPLERDIEDWEREGTGITARARLLDAERQRELTAAKYGLQAKGQAARAKAADEYKTATESRRLADEVAKEEERKTERAFREGIAGELSEARKSRLDLSEQIHQDRLAENARRATEREEALKREEELRAAKEQSFDAMNKRLSAFASQRGIQTKLGPGKEMTAYDIANYAATEDAFNHPAFKDLLTKTNKGYRINPRADKRRLEALGVYINNIKQKYLRGEF